VIGGASSFEFKGRAFDLPDLCTRTRAGYVVQGSVRRAAGRVRISVQLIEGATGVQLWGDRYDREMVDVFALQDEVTRTIAATLGVKMQDVVLQRALRKSAAELSAYDCLLRARRYTWMLSAEMHAEARDLLEKAVELDPLSADAHGLLANVYLGEHRFEMNPRPNPIGRALVHALAATRLDPQNAYARCWLAIVHFFRGENEKFEAEAQLALSLNPNDPETLADVGHYYAFMGQFERGVELSRRAQQLNPSHPGWYHFSFARLHYHEGKYQQTIADVETRAAALLLDAYADRGGEGETRPRGRQPSAGAHLRGEAELLRTRRAAQVERRTGGSGAHSRRAAEGGFAGVTLGRWCDRAAPTANAALAHELAACPNRAPTARFQPAYLRSRSFAGNAGLKPRSSFHNLAKPCALGHTPAR